MQFVAAPDSVKEPPYYHCIRLRQADDCMMCGSSVRPLRSTTFQHPPACHRGETPLRLVVGVEPESPRLTRAPEWAKVRSWLNPFAKYDEPTLKVLPAGPGSSVRVK